MLLDMRNHLMVAKLVLALTLMTLTGCSGASTCAGGYVIQTGQQWFCVPTKNLWSNPKDSGPRHGPMIRFWRADYAAAAPGYTPETDVNGKPIDTDVVLMIPVDEAGAQRMLHKGVGQKDFEDLWFGRGDWRDRQLEPIEGTPWYRAYWFPQYKNSWQVLSELPDEAAGTHRKPGFWLASCYLRDSGTRTCGSQYLLKPMGLVLELDLEERNLVHRDAIARYIQAQLESWRVKR
jgi:hypothetical protein